LGAPSIAIFISMPRLAISLTLSLPRNEKMQTKKKKPKDSIVWICKRQYFQIYLVWRCWHKKANCHYISIFFSGCYWLDYIVSLSSLFSYHRGKKDGPNHAGGNFCDHLWYIWLFSLLLLLYVPYLPPTKARMQSRVRPSYSSYLISPKLNKKVMFENTSEVESVWGLDPGEHRFPIGLDLLRDLPQGWR